MKIEYTNKDSLWHTLGSAPVNLVCHQWKTHDVSLKHVCQYIYILVSITSSHVIFGPIESFDILTYKEVDHFSQRATHFPVAM